MSSNSGSSSITWRQPTEADLDACLAVQPEHLGDELTGPEIARGVWSELLRHPATVSAVFECEPPVDGHRIVAFGAAAFISAEFTDSELANPRPFINARVIESIHAGHSVLLTADEMARLNAGNGLDLFHLCGSWLESILSPEQNLQVQTLLGVSLTQLLGGYRMNRIFGEAIDCEMRFMRKSGVVSEIGTFPELNRVINLATPLEARAQAFSIAGEIFSHREPLLRLSAAEQALLSAALEGQTDADLASSLGLSLPAVKARWRSILARFAQMEPSLAPAFEGQGGRGPQKRHRVLSWLRGRPEELRPYSPDPRSE